MYILILQKQEKIELFIASNYRGSNAMTFTLNWAS